MSKLFLLSLLMFCISDSTVLESDVAETWNIFLRDYLLQISEQCLVPPFDLIPKSLLQRIQRRTVNINLYAPTTRKFGRPKTIYSIQDVSQLLANPSLYTDRQTVIYVHGWRNHPEDESTRTIVRALAKADGNVLVMDASKFMSDPYITSTTHVFRLGKILNEFIVQLVKIIPIDSVHLIGFSLGAHITGVAGMLFLKQTGKRIQKITALDPAKPCFVEKSKYRLSKDAAKHVEVFHTNTGTLGLEEPLGHTDVYVNGLIENQPDCDGKVGISLLVCNHGLAWRLYANSIERIGSLKAWHCKSWTDLKRSQCSSTKAYKVGYGTGNNSGLYYLNTYRLLNRKQRYSDRSVMNRMFWLLDVFLQ